MSTLSSPTFALRRARRGANEDNADPYARVIGTCRCMWMEAVARMCSERDRAERARSGGAAETRVPCAGPRPPSARVCAVSGGGVLFFDIRDT